MEQHPGNVELKRKESVDITKDKLAGTFLSPWACDCNGLIKDAGGSCPVCQGNGLEGADSQFQSLKSKGRRFSTGCIESRLDQFLKYLVTNPRYKEDRNHRRVVGMYKYHREIGSGGFSKVKLATHIFSREKVAIKIIDKNKFPGQLEKVLGQEVRCMEVLNHPNLIRLYEVIESTSKIHLVTELAPCGDLYSKVKLNGKIEESKAKPIFRQVVDAISYMHDHKIFHRDIKAENVLFSSATLCKLCDFGFSTVGKKERLLSTFCGSPSYSAPELYQKVRYLGGPADAWSLGILLFFMTEGHLPFNGDTMFAIKESILEGHFEVSENSSKELTQLIKKILKQKPSQRFTVSQMKNHPWLFQSDEELQHEAAIKCYNAFNNHSLYDLQESILSNLSLNQEKNCDDDKDSAGSKAKDSSDEVIYSLIPTKEQIMHRKVSKEEMKAYEVLIEIGVTEARIRAHRKRGIRSYLIGIYRIILHKIERGELVNVNKLGLPWNLSNSMTNLNSCLNLREADEDQKENKRREDDKKSNGEAKCGGSSELSEKEVKLDEKKEESDKKEGASEKSNGVQLTSVSSQKKRMLTRTGSVGATKICVIL